MTSARGIVAAVGQTVEDLFATGPAASVSIFGDKPGAGTQHPGADKVGGGSALDGVADSPVARRRL